MKWDDTFRQIFKSIPTHQLAYTDLEYNDPFGLTRAIGEELDRRYPGPLPTQYDHNGNEIKIEVIGFDEKGREIWLEV